MYLTEILIRTVTVDSLAGFVLKVLQVQEWPHPVSLRTVATLMHLDI